MKTSCLISLLFAVAATAAPALEARQQSPDPTAQNNSRQQTIEVTNIDWQRSGSTINGIRFQATVVGANPAESYRCTSDSSSGAFASTKIDRCARGSPITFAYTQDSGSRLQVWYTNGVKSYAGETTTTPGNTTPFTLQMLEVDPSPTSTPPVNP